MFRSPKNFVDSLSTISQVNLMLVSQCSSARAANVPLLGQPMFLCWGSQCSSAGAANVPLLGQWMLLLDYSGASKTGMAFVLYGEAVSTKHRTFCLSISLTLAFF